MLRKIVNLYKQLKVIAHINSHYGEIIDSSGTFDDDAYIKLNSGKYFFSQKSPYYLRRLHFLLRKDLRERIPADLMLTLFDINFRYMGRKNQKLNLKEGKYLALKSGDVVFEIGAYIGFHAMKMSELVGKDGKIIAVEAVPENFRLLEKNIEVNKINNITPVPLAVWEKRGVIPFNLNENQENSACADVVESKRQMEISCDTIDNICQQQKLAKIDFVRIQTNGAELEALNGMTDVLKMNPSLLVAVPYKNRDSIEQILIEEGYRTTFTGHSIFAEKA